MRTNAAHNSRQNSQSCKNLQKKHGGLKTP
jgi:hypothetical protein